MKATSSPFRRRFVKEDGLGEQGVTVNHSLAGTFIAADWGDGEGHVKHDDVIFPGSFRMKNEECRMRNARTE